MSDLAWSEYNGLWRPLDAEKRLLWPQAQIDTYDAYTWRNETRASPAAFAKAVSPEWQDFEHVLYISNIIADFIFDRLLAANGKPAKRLFLTMPPRHGKSFLLSEHVPAWFLTLFPNEQVILTTYEANFAAKWGGKVRSIIEAHGDKYGLQLSPSSAAKNRWSLNKPHRGGMITAGMGGPITGEGGGLLIGDDWVKNSDEARSQPWRDSAWDWYNTTFKTRLQKDLSKGDAARQPKMLLLMTRWHEDDPMGRLLAAQGDDMVTIHLPALAGPDDPLGREEGEALCPAILTTAELKELQREDALSFEALYQGNPTLEEGGLFSKSDFRYWRAPNTQSDDLNEAEGRALSLSYVLKSPEGAEKHISRADCLHFITVDLAISEKKRADYTVFSAFALTPGRDLLLIARFRDRIEEADHLPRLQQFYDDLTGGNNGLKIPYVGIENQTFGLTLISNARRDSNMPIRALKADKDKVSRAIPAGLLTQGGKFYLPSHTAWTAEFVSEATSFPNGKHDDQVDTFAYAVEAMNTMFRHHGTKQRAAAADRDPSGRLTLDAHMQKIADRNARERRRQRGRSRTF